MMALEDSVNPMQGISGPGSFSKRTDLQYQSEGYGDGVAYDAAKAGAPLAKSPDVRGATPTAVRDAAEASITPLFAPTQRPDEPITTGIDMGPGAGSDILMGRPQATEKLSDTLAKMLPYDQTGEVAILYQNALARGM
jgi:hypothetical protein